MPTRILDEQIKNEPINIDDKLAFNVIENSTLEKCIISNAAPTRGLGLERIVLNECEFHTSVRLTKFSWLECSLVNTKFFGCYQENEFGHLDEVSGFGNLDRCDFSGAILDDCLFYNCDVGSIMFPGWPHFVVLNPREHTKRMAAKAPSRSLRSIVDSLDLLHPGVVATASFSPSVAKESSVTEEDLRGFLSQFTNVLM